MTQKLSFSVENAEIINENPNSNFAILELDFFASGKNLHDMYVSEETLMRTADTIKKCPLIWKYDNVLDDIGTHDKDEVPCGFVPETSIVRQKVTSDGRTMLSVIAYIWKRYTGELLGFFKRDGGKKPVSVEMSVYKTQTMQSGLLELLDFRYEGITVLGSFITPAIPSAKAQVVSFSELEKEYEEDLIKEFSEEEIVKFPYKSVEDISPALKGINPPITVFQANEIARQAESIEEDNKNKGWAIAISTFEQTHRVVDERWVEKENKETMAEQEFTNQNILGLSQPEKEEVSVEKEKDVEMTEVTQETEVTMAEDAKPEEEKPEGEATPAEKEKEEGKEKKFEFPKNFNLEKMQALFSDDEDEDDEEEVKMAKSEIEKGEFADPSIMMSGMFAKMCKMAGIIAKMAEDSKVYMSENEALKKFKADVEESQKIFAVEQTFRELEEKVIIPQEAKEEMLAKAEEFSFDDLESWKVYCKAKSFEFAVREVGKEDVVKVGMPFSGIAQKRKDDLWG